MAAGTSVPSAGKHGSRPGPASSLRAPPLPGDELSLGASSKGGRPAFEGVAGLPTGSNDR